MFSTKNNFLLIEEKEKGEAGKIIRSFFQGIITNDINLLEPLGESPGFKALYTLMLSPKGRFLYDFFLYNFPDSDSYNSASPCTGTAAKILLEYNSNYRDNLLKTLELYNLHKKVLISEINYHSYVFYVSQAAKEPLSSLDFSKENFSNGAKAISSSNNNYYYYCYSDPRSEKLGIRIIASQELLVNKINKAERSNLEDPVLKEELIRKYNLARIKALIIDSGLDLISGEAFPLEYNLEYAFSFNKGCYVGQEVTARFKFKNQLKRKLFLIYSEDKFPVAQTELKYNNISLGKILSHEGNYALALFDLEIINQLDIKKQIILNGLAIDIIQ